MTKLKNIKYALIFTGATALFIGIFKKTNSSGEPITKQRVTIEYDICSPDTNYSKMVNIAENQYTEDTLLESVSSKSYKIKDSTYYLIENADGFVETGSASWYGPNFHGKKTASGDTYNQYEHTAAHKTLPFGTRVKVENLDNNTSTIVVINDRGPFAHGRIIDLSYSAANDLNIVKKGVANVKLTVIEEEQPTITPTQKVVEYATSKAR